MAAPSRLQGTDRGTIIINDGLARGTMVEKIAFERYAPTPLQRVQFLRLNFDL